jgi:hypothetical protein
MSRFFGEDVLESLFSVERGRQNRSPSIGFIDACVWDRWEPVRGGVLAAHVTRDQPSKGPPHPSSRGRQARVKRGPFEVILR